MTVFTECPHRHESVGLWVPPIHCRIFWRVNVKQVSVVAMTTIRFKRTNSELTWVQDASRRTEYIMHNDGCGLMSKTWLVLGSATRHADSVNIPLANRTVDELVKVDNEAFSTNGRLYLM